MGSDYRIALLCNAYSTNTEYFNRPMQALVDTILGSQKGPQQTPVPPLLNNAALANGWFYTSIISLENINTSDSSTI